MKQSNNPMKRLLALLLAMLMMLALAACAATEPPAEDPAEEPSAEEPADDASGEEEEALAPAEDATELPEEPVEEIEPVLDPAGSYSLVNYVYNWGSNYGKIILKDASDAEAVNYTVSVWRYDTAGGVLDHGERAVTAAYASDAEGNESADGGYVTLDVEVSAASGLGAPYYTDPDSFYSQLKSWADCSYTITNNASGQVWNQLETVYHPDEEAFETGSFTAADGVTMSYASYAPEEDGAKHPLIIWLHGAGSGGTDIGFVTGGMLVTNFISEETQAIFGGAHVLLPQSPTWWLDDGSEYHYSADGSNIYNVPMMELIEKYIAEHPDVDRERIYIGGCSNGGYMTVAMCLAYEDYFAAGFPVCEAYQDAWITDEGIQILKETPLWFVHCSNDPVVDVTTTSVPTYQRLLAADADVHYTTFETIIDPDYGNEYGGHFAWVYALKNLCTTDYDGSSVVEDGKEVSLFEWLAAQN
ncbi:MAG: prolyl oligopeptidase family serine peptidase [Oscillospiraceae bacterium]|nr:prolyl oligopeptidase family serine peptidase [Oscillospiraceae bacterium]